MSHVIVDIEANGLLEEADRVWCICTHDLDTGARYTFIDPAYLSVYPNSGSISDGVGYLNQCEEVIMHNGIFYDAPLLRKVGMPLTCKITDSLLLSQLSRFDREKVAGTNAGPHSVEAWGIRFGRAKPAHEDWTQLSAEMLHRCREDVEIQTRIYLTVKKEMQVAGKWDFAIWLEHEFAKLIQQQNTRGWPFDSERAREHLAYLNSEMDRLYNNIQPFLPLVRKDEKLLKQPLLKSGGWTAATAKWVESHYPGAHQDGPDGLRIAGQYYKWSVSGAFCRIDYVLLNPGSDQQLKAWLLAIGWRPTEWNIDKKTRKPTSPKLTEDSYNSLKIGVGPDIAQWLKCKHRRSMIEGWLKLVRADGTIKAPSFPIGTPTGRQRHKVIVNVPNEDAYFGKELRELFIALPERVIVGGDSASCQARMLCHRMGDEAFTNAVVNGKKEDGTDIHSFNMNATGVSARTDAKRFFYAFIFGAQAAKIGSIIGKGKEAGQTMINNYYANVPLLKELLDSLYDFWKQHGYIIGMDGRAVFVRKKNDLLCYDLQLGEAISMKLAAILVNTWAIAEGLDFNMLIHYHDEIQYDVNPAHTSRFKELLLHAIQYAGVIMQLAVPLDGEIKVGASWGETH